MSNLSPRAPAQDARKKRPLDLQRISFMWDLWTGLYMLEPWEKMVFNGFLVVLFSSLLYYFV